MLAAHTRQPHLSQSSSSRTPRPGCACVHRSAQAASTAPGIELELASGFKASFPATGSGLLWARSTGLKVWDGAKVLSQLLLLPIFPQQVVELHPTYRAHLSSGSSSSSSKRKLSSLKGRTVVELGAGLGLCSVAAAHRGAQVTATDGDPDLVRLLKKNLAFNNGDAPPTTAGSARQLRLQRQAYLSGRHTNSGASQASVGSDVRGASHSEQAVKSSVEGDGSSTSGRSSKSESSGACSSQQGTRFLYAPRASLLPWGDERAAHELKQSLRARWNSETLSEPLDVRHHQQQQRQQPQQQEDFQGQRQSESGGSPDLILMAEVVYGSDPGVWEALIKTLKALCSPGTLILQAESRRIEGVLYGEYWAALEREGFHIVELPLPQLLGPDLGLGLHSTESASGSEMSGSGSEMSASSSEVPVSASSWIIPSSGSEARRDLSKEAQAGSDQEGEVRGVAGAVEQTLPTSRSASVASRHPHVRAWAIHLPVQ